MVTSPAASGLIDALKSKVKDLEDALAGVTEDEASRPLDGDWTIRHVLSHLLGPDDGRGLAGRLRRIVDEDVPALDVNVDDPVFTPVRKQMSCRQLLQALRDQCEDAASFLAGCTEEQFARRVQLPASFKDSPLTDTPTLGQWSAGLIHFHLAGHIAQIREHRKQWERSNS